MAPLEPWEKVIIDAETFAADVHGALGCTTCHAGQEGADKETAHTGLVARPSENPQVCAACHAETVETFATSLHSTQAGYWYAISQRAGIEDLSIEELPAEHPELAEMFGNHCASCHTTCGDCHVSQPASVGGGLIDNHVFNRTPSMTRNCTACHGSRVGNEFLGKNEGILADVHFRQGRMRCTDCHTGAEMHGEVTNAQGEPPAHRYDGEPLPACTDCHPTVGAAEDQIQMHQVHGNGQTLSCQVCHSVTYTSCDGCHVQVNEETGNPFFRTEATYLTFFIGRNPLLSESRPYEYVPVRHVPIAPTSYEYYGENLLPNFDALPTWVHATPHNIQLNTPQNESCDTCHGSSDLFLTADKVAPGELAANASVIVETLPPALGAPGAAGGEGGGEAAAATMLPETHLEFVACLECHTSGAASVPPPPENHSGYTSNEICTQCHQRPEVSE